MKETSLFNGIYGYDSIKTELLMIQKWYFNKNKYPNDIMLPKGIMFYGRPGCGKTLIIREYAKSFKCNIYSIEGKSENIIEEICDTFSKARNDSFAIVLIDEIDLLIDKDQAICRSIQSEMDGINNNGSILVLATTNNYNNLNPALLRSGRFDRKININPPDKKSRKELLKKFIEELDGDDTYVNYDRISQLSHCTCADLKAVINDAYLRGDGKFTTEGIEQSFQRVIYGNYQDNASDYKNMRVAIHEAGHAIVASLCKNWKYYCARFTENGGLTELSEIDENVDTIEKREESIMISMAGYISEKVLLGNKDIGSYSDYQKAYDLATRFVERVCINGIGRLICQYKDNNDRYESQKKRLKNEKQVINLLKKYERKTTNMVKNNKTIINNFAQKLYENGKLYCIDYE